MELQRELQCRNPRQCRASRLQQCKRHRSVAPMQDGTERCVMVRDALSVVVAQK